MPRGYVVNDEEFIEVFRSTEDAFLTAAEVAEKIGTTRQTANRRLKNLHEEGVLLRKEAGARAVGYWLADSASELAA